MKKVFICSAYRGNIEENIKKARKYCAYTIRLGYLPIAPHLYFPQFLHDKNPLERNIGISCGLDLLKECDLVFVFGDETEGMQKEIKAALENDISIIRYDEKLNILKPLIR